MKEKIIRNLPIIIILTASVLIVWPVFLPGYFSHQDDLQVMRIYEMRKCLMDLQIPCRWVPDMGFGNGFPLFNYYGVLPYYLGALLSFICGYIWAAKFLFFIPLFFGGLGMYLLSKIFFGKMGGFISGVLYMFAPYKALDIYVRGAISESFALMLIPFVFLFIVRLSEKRTIYNFLGLSVFTSLFLLSHNLMTMIFSPFVMLVVILLMFIGKIKNLIWMIVSLAIGFGSTFFYLIPAFFEKNLIHEENLTRFGFDFRANFVSLPQIFLDRNWGYGQSVDKISLQIGWPHWWLVVLIIMIMIFSLFNKQLQGRLKHYYFLLVLLIAVFLWSIFMMHIRSSFIWEQIPMLSYMQFPWRFLSITIFAASLIGGAVTFLLRGSWRYLIAGIIVGLTLFFNLFYFQPEHFYFDTTDSQKLSGEEFLRQQSAIIMDYLPKTSQVEPREIAPDAPLIKSGEAEIISFDKKSNSFSSEINVKSSAKIEFPIFYFPNWEVYLNGQKLPADHKNLLGRITIESVPGQYLFKGKFEDTSLRFWSNMVSLTSVCILVILIFIGKRKKWWEK